MAGKTMWLVIWLLLGLIVSTSAAADRSAYIVHMDKSFMPAIFDGHHSWYSSTIDSLGSSDAALTTLDGAPQLIYTYNHVMHGFSATLSDDELAKLRLVKGFVSAYRDPKVMLQTTHTDTFLGLSEESGVWHASHQGEGVIIGVIDSGIWPESPSFHDFGMTNVPIRWKGECETGQLFNSSMCNRKLIGARYFNKGLNANNPTANNIEINSPRDTDGHGTHTASIAAGSHVSQVSFHRYGLGTAKGMAPRSRIAVYKVSSYGSDVAKAMDQAVEDGVDVISISLTSSNNPLYADPIAIASFGAMQNNVFVSIAAGNHGPEIGSLHNGVPWALMVAAGSVDRSFGGTLTLRNGVKAFGWSLFPGSATPTLPIIYEEKLSKCNSPELLARAPRGIIICRNEPSLSVFKQIKNVKVSNVLGAVFISDRTNFIRFKTLNFPGLVISSKDGTALISYTTKVKKPRAKIEFQQTRIGVQVHAPIVASYSSRGPSRNSPQVLKPDILAPGSQILAAWVPDHVFEKRRDHSLSTRNYMIESGTSMACPHASGVAALLKGARPEWSPADIMSAMMTTANPLDNSGNHIREYINHEDTSVASPLAMGAGRIDPNRALDPGLLYQATPQDYVHLLCQMKFTRAQIKTITRNRTYSCRTMSSFQVNYPSFIAVYQNQMTSLNRTFRRTLTYIGGGTATYNVQCNVLSTWSVKVIPEELVFGVEDQMKDYKVILSIDALNGEISHGALIWVEQNGNHKVRSPIVVAPLA